MNAVLGYIALLAEEIDGPVSELQRTHLERVQLSAKHLLELIDALLNYARIEAGEETVRAEEIPSWISSSSTFVVSLPVRYSPPR